MARENPDQTEAVKPPDPPARAPREDAGKRVVLMAFELKVSDLPDEVKKHPLLKGKRGTVEVWWPVATNVDKADKTKAIYSVAEVDGEEVPGSFRAPSMASWKGGLKLDPPPKVKMDRLALD